MSVLFGLLRKQKYHFLHPYRDEAYSTIKATIRQVCFTTRELLCGRINKLTSYSYFKMFGNNFNMWIFPSHFFFQIDSSRCCG